MKTLVMLFPAFKNTCLPSSSEIRSSPKRFTYKYFISFQIGRVDCMFQLSFRTPKYRNLKLKKREDELQMSVNKLEAKQTELQAPRFDHESENGILPRSSQIEPSSRTEIFDTKDLF